MTGKLHGTDMIRVVGFVKSVGKVEIVGMMLAIGT